MVLMACRPETQAPTPIIPKAASAPIAASEPTSAIVSQILNSPQEQDILASSKQAMENITASEVALVGASAVAVASSAAVEVLNPPRQQCICLKRASVIISAWTDVLPNNRKTAKNYAK